MNNLNSVQVLVVDDRLVTVMTDTSDAPRATSVEVCIDGQRLRGWEEPGWRPIGLGVANGRPFWWSARRLVALDLEPSRVAVDVTTDEDILFAFALAHARWLVVAETSVRLLRGIEEVSRLDLGEVVSGCSLSGAMLTIGLGDGSSIRVDVLAGELRETS